jgi:hypothetical protein
LAFDEILAFLADKTNHRVRDFSGTRKHRPRFVEVLGTDSNWSDVELRKKPTADPDVRLNLDRFAKVRDCYEDLTLT